MSIALGVIWRGANGRATHHVACVAHSTLWTAAEVRAYLAYWGRSARLGRPGVALGRPFTPVKPPMYPLGPRAVGPLRLGSNSIATPRGAN
eukprot:scaffold22457_cov52-Phaeocystis_antarctica.AAC.1